MAEVTRRHRELAFKVLGHSTDVNSYVEPGWTLVNNWLERGIDGGPPMFEQESRIARALADIEAEALAQVPRWISCEERMPPDGEDALVYAPARGVDWATFDEDNGGRWLWQYSGYGILSEVTHWMPVPSPPETK